MDIEGLNGNAHTTPRITKHVKEGARNVKDLDVAKARDEDVDFVQVWEDIRVVVNMHGQ